ncbi:MAG: hypothetical protein DHS20C18_04720 [Saprospiraceae bacterium]|nr:MAG: hypothetical protein DHS20C18_04720 [Saprospiraceae bacterium]
MKRIFLSVLSSLLLFHTSLAQVFSGQQAKQKMAGTELIRYTAGNDLPAYIRLASQTYVAEADGIDYLKKLLKLGPEIDFELLEITTDQLGYKHYRYQQKIQDIPVFAGIYLLHCRDGKVVSVNGALFDQPQGMNKRAGLDADEALALAMQYMPAATYAWEVLSPASGTPIAEYPKPELVWVPRHLDYQSPEFRLAYRLDMYAMEPLHRAWLYIDAQTGLILAEENRICHIDEEGIALTSLSGERPIVADRVSAGQYRLRERGRGDGIITLNMNHETAYELAIDFEDDDNYWNNVNANLDETATDAHWGAERFFDYLLENHDRLSLDNAGAPLISYIHFGIDYGNAFWDGTASTFGDGDPGGALNLPVVALDIVAHEFAHGLTEFSAGLIYQDESGALNESFSDIFGKATDHYARPEATNWLVGQESTVGGVGIRSLADPNSHEDPDTYLGDFYQFGGGDGGGVHTNSGVMNHWFYLLNVGGSGTNDYGNDFEIEGIGWEKAMQIVYRNLTVYLTPSATYEDAAFYANTAALDLFGGCSNEYLQNNNAWYAVGLGTPQQEVTMAAFNAQQLHCSLPVEVQFTNNSSWSAIAFWDFGDGQTSMDFHPIHEYTQPGTYDVTLVATGCEGLVDTLIRSSFIVVDTTQAYCDTIQMQFIGEQTITNCSGVVLDPGGSENYMDGSYSILTIAPPNSGPIQLDFIEFETEFCCDRLNIYDGPNIDAPQIASFEGTEGLGQMLVANSGQVTLEFLSDGSATFSGFVVKFSTTGGLNPPIAGFNVNNLNPPILFPLQFTDQSDPSGTITWDFGDGQMSSQRNPIHAYSTPGNYSARQVIRNCYGQDTSYQEILVQESGLVSWSPDSICVTLFSGELLDTTVQVQNLGPGDLYYHLEAPQAQVSDQNEIVYTTAQATTQHFFDGLSSTLQELTITVTLSGDYDDILEFAELYIDGELIGVIEDEDPPNGTDIIKMYTFEEDTIAPWLADGLLEITLVNSEAVSVGFGGNDSHRVSIVGRGAGWLSLEQNQGILTNNESTSVPVHIDAADLLDGVYHTNLPLINGDLSHNGIKIPVKLTVIGIPEIAVNPENFDFGSVFLGSSVEDSVTVVNAGTRTLIVFSISSDGPAFVPDTLDVTVPPRDSVRIHLTFTPPEVGIFSTNIHFQSDAGDIAVPVIGAGVYPPDISVQPDSICVTLLAGSTTTESLTIANNGLGNLDYNLLVNDGFVDMVVSLYGVDVNEEYPHMLDALNEHFTNYNLETTFATDPLEFAQALVGKEVLLFPESEFGSNVVYEQLAPVIQDFVNNGGGVIFCYVSGGAPVIHSNIFDVATFGDISAGTQMAIQAPIHPLAEGVTAPVFALNATQGILFDDPAVTTIIDDGFDLSALAAKTYGAGKAIFIGYDYFSTDANANRILANAVQWVAGNVLPGWLQIDPLSGVVDPAGNQILTLDFDAAGLLAGTYEFELIIKTNDLNHPEVLVPVKMIVQAFPQVNFSATPNFSCDGQVNFTDHTLNLPTAWYWEFGDGQTSTQPNPTHIYTTNGFYDVQLVACNNLGCDTLIREQLVEVDLAGSFCDTVIMATTGTTFHTTCTGVLFDNGGPDGNYTDGVNVTTIIEPPAATQITLYFDDFFLESCCDFVSIYDGPSTDAPLIGSYYGTSLAGTTIMTTGGAVTITFHTNESVVYPGFAMRWECDGQPPQAAFSSNPVGECGNELAFNNLSNNGTSYLWDFGDGSTSEAVSPQHVFGGTGTYTVALTTYNDFGGNTTSQSVTIDEIPFDLAINAPDTVLANDVVHFSYSASVPVGLLWDFGPAGTTESPNPSYIFLLPRTYDIYLLATAANGCQMFVHHPITVLVNTAVEETANDISVHLFPNPTSGPLTINLEMDQPREVQLEWYNALGQRLEKQQLPRNSSIHKILDFRAYPKGLYWLVLKDDRGWNSVHRVTMQ